MSDNASSKEDSGEMDVVSEDKSDLMSVAALIDALREVRIIRSIIFMVKTKKYGYRERR